MLLNEVQLLRKVNQAQSEEISNLREQTALMREETGQLKVEVSMLREQTRRIAAIEALLMGSGQDPLTKVSASH